MHTLLARRRALVLGGGGSTGNAWLIGVVAGLSSAGVDVTDADFLVGTSAGSTAAVQLAGADPATLVEQALTPVPARASNAAVGVPDRLGQFRAVIASSADPDDMRRRMGAAAREPDRDPDGAWTDRWRSIVARRLPASEWPDREIAITAVDADTGAPAVFDRRSGVTVADAVAASCSSSVAYRIGERRYIDGGYRRNENADLAEGSERVLVLSPFGGRTMHPLDWRMQLAAQVAELRASGSSVETVFPAPDDEFLFGPNAMDPTLRPAAAAAGRRLGVELADRVGTFWRP